MHTTFGQDWGFSLNLKLVLKFGKLAILNAKIPLNNARISRNDTMYKENIGLVDVATDVKTYIKSVFGATSPQYKTVSILKFTNYSN